MNLDNTDPRPERCGTCKAWRPGPEDSPVHGTCHLHPRTVVWASSPHAPGGVLSYWPDAHKTSDWCLDWVPNAAEAKRLLDEELRIRSETAEANRKADEAFVQGYRSHP